MPESTQPWNLIPYADQPERADELLIVKEGENSRRITQKKYIYDQIAELSWVVNGSSNTGIGTANQWGNIPYNNKEGPEWCTLHADGSFELAAGAYLLETETQGCFCNSARFRLFDGDNTLLYKYYYLGASSVVVHSSLALKKKLSLSESKVFSFQVNISSVVSIFFYQSFDVLSGLNPTIAQAFIWRLG